MQYIIKPDKRPLVALLMKDWKISFPRITNKTKVPVLTTAFSIMLEVLVTEIRGKKGTGEVATYKLKTKETKCSAFTNDANLLHEKIQKKSTKEKKLLG